MSVSEIVVLHQNGENSAHFVDSFGFTGLPNSMQTLEGVKEQEAEIDTFGQDVQKSEQEKQEPETSTTRWKRVMKSLTLVMKRNRSLQI